MGDSILQLLLVSSHSAFLVIVIFVVAEVAGSNGYERRSDREREEDEHGCWFVRFVRLPSSWFHSIFILGTDNQPAVNVMRSAGKSVESLESTRLMDS